MSLGTRIAAKPARSAPQQPLLSVVICCYSGECFFEDAVESVLAQTFQDFQLVFHDNGADPRYQTLIDTVAERTGARIVRTEVNLYGEGLRAEVLPEIKTPYLAILHDDDTYRPQKLERSMRALTENGVDFIFTDRQYTDAAGVPLAQNYDEINSRPFSKEDYPYQYVADTFYRGLRFHFSTFVCKTDLARETLLGDPYVPRIADSAFAARLLLDRRFVGYALDERLTDVRVHGGNDMLYSKFSIEQRGRELLLLSHAEYYIFAGLLRDCDDKQLAGVLACYPGIEPARRADRTTVLIQAALMLANEGRSKKLMAALCLHEAFRREPKRAIEQFRRLAGSSANAFMLDVYSRYTHDEVWSFRAFLPGRDGSGGPIDPAPLGGEIIQPLRRQALELAASSSWTLTAPLRRIAASLRGRPAPKGHEAIHGLVQPYAVGEEVSLADASSVRYLMGGFSSPEPWGRWTDGAKATIGMSLPSALSAGELFLSPVYAFSTPGNVQTLRIRLNMREAGTFEVHPGHELRIKVSRKLMRSLPFLIIDIMPTLVKGLADEPIADRRGLGVGLESFRFSYSAG